MDSERDDTDDDDDVTIVGDHELVVELRRIAAERSRGAGALPPPAWPVSTGPGHPRPSASTGAPRPGSPAASRRPAPPAPAPRVVSDDEWWYDDDDDATASRFVWLAIACVVAALVVVGLVLLR
jgi:hypothetical protein